MEQRDVDRHVARPLRRPRPGGHSYPTLRFGYELSALRAYDIASRRGSFVARNGPSLRGPSSCSRPPARGTPDSRPALAEVSNLGPRRSRDLRRSADVFSRSENRPPRGESSGVRTAWRRSVSCTHVATATPGRTLVPYASLRVRAVRAPAVGRGVLVHRREERRTLSGTGRGFQPRPLGVARDRSGTAFGGRTSARFAV